MTTLDTLLKEILQFRDERDWAQFHTPKNLAAALSVETAELQEAMLWKTDAEVAQQLADPQKRQAIRHELADVMIFALLFAQATGIDPTEAVREKLVHNAAKYPVEKSRGNAKKYTEHGNAE